MVQQELRYKAYMIATISLLLLIGLIAFTRTRLQAQNNLAKLAQLNKLADGLPSVAKATETESKTNQTGSTSVTVNGQSIKVPVNGSTHQTIPTAGGETSVDISNESSGSGSETTDRSHSSTRISVRSHSSGETFSSSSTN